MRPHVTRTRATRQEVNRRRLVARYPEYEIQINQLLDQNIPAEYVRETVALARKYHVAPTLLVDILNSLLRRASQRAAGEEPDD